MINNKIIIGIEKLSASAILPQYATIGSSGMDLFANIAQNITIKPFARVIIPIGIAIELPEGLEAQIRSRSGLAAKHGVVVLNSPGTIDSDYRGEIKVILYNSSDNEFVVEPNMRIAQMVIAPVYRVFLEEVFVDKDSSARGEKGFGSTGIKMKLKDEK